MRLLNDLLYSCDIRLLYRETMRDCVFDVPVAIIRNEVAHSNEDIFDIITHQQPLIKIEVYM